MANDELMRLAAGWRTRADEIGEDGIVDLTHSLKLRDCAQELEDALRALAQRAPQNGAVPEGWRQFVQECAGTAGGEVCGNSLSSRAKALLAAAPAPEAERAKREALKSDRDVLVYLMGQFNTEIHVCERCGHEDPTCNFDSALYLRGYLSANSSPEPAQSSQPNPEICRYCKRTPAAGCGDEVLAMNTGTMPRCLRDESDGRAEDVEALLQHHEMWVANAKDSGFADAVRFHEECIATIRRLASAQRDGKDGA